MQDSSFHHFGPQPAKHTIVYVHGFAVNYRSKGLFSDLAQHLAELGISSLLFNLSDYDEAGNSFFLPLSDQQKRLRAAYTAAAERSDKVSLIAHSMGCGVACSLIPALKFERVLLLAPGGRASGRRIEAGMLKRPLSRRNPDGSVSFKRKNDTWSTFSKRYIEEFSINFFETYRARLRKKSSLGIYLAESDSYDQVDFALLQALGAIVLPDSDHNFSATARSQILQKAAEFFA